VDMGLSPRKKNDESFQESDDDDDEEEEELSSSMLLSNSLHDHGEDELGSGSRHSYDHDKDQPNLEQSFEIDMGMGINMPLPLNKLKRTASIQSGTFENAIFGNQDDHSRVFEHMSSYQDLKFLVRELRKFYNNDGKQTVVFGSMHRACTVVPPRQWSHDHKTAFHTWLKDHLGFCLRSGGVMVNFLQTTKQKGKKTLDMLEAALLSYKKSTNHGGTGSGAGADKALLGSEKTKQYPIPMSSIKIKPHPTALTPLLPSLKRSTLKTTPMLPGVRSSLPR
jgi:hypothetical protein